MSVRERNRAGLRQRLSDVATSMFLEHGFDAVTVKDVARACGVTEKTVYNHFDSKESLLVDRWHELVVRVRADLADVSVPLVDGVVAALSSELDFLTQAGRASAEQMASTRAFGALVASTPSLQDHRRRSQQQLSAAILAVVAVRWRTGEDDPQVQIAAEALTGLVTVFYRSLGRHARHDAASCRREVAADLQQAARRLAAGVRD